MGMSAREVTYLCFSLLLLTLSNMSFAAFTSFFPPAMVGFGIRQTLIAPIFSAFMVAQLSTSMVSGALATRFGRQPVLCCGVCFVAVGPILFAFVPDVLAQREWPQVVAFVLCRMIMGVGGALVQTVTMSTLSDGFPAHRSRVLSLANSAGSLAWTIGPPVGGILYSFGGFRLPFIASGILPPFIMCAILATSPIAPPGSPAAKKKNEPPPTRNELLRWFRAVSSIGLYLPPLAAAVVSAKWSTFDMGVTLWMMGEFDFSIQRASLCFTCASLAFAICSPIMGYIGDTIPKHTMKWMIVTGLLLNFFNAFSMQWTLTWQLQHRIVYAYAICFTEGFCSTVLFACCLPDCHRTAEIARKSTNADSTDATVASDAALLSREAATNYVTSVFVTLQTVGGLVGPFVGAPLLAGTANPFGLTDNVAENPGGHIRIAIPTMSSGMLAVALFMTITMLGGCVPNGKGLDELPQRAQQGATGVGELPAEEDNERERLLANP